jgi:hypothetical protein
MDPRVMCVGPSKCIYRGFGYVEGLWLCRGARRIPRVLTYLEGVNCQLSTANCQP